jgi:predicted ester cyclase
VTSQTPADLYRRWILELWNGRLEVAEELVSEGFVVHQARMDGASSEVERGPGVLRRMVEEGRGPFETLTFSIEVGPLVDAGGEMVAGRWRAEGTYAGGIPGLDAPRGTPVTWDGTDILRVEDGRFVEYWVSADTHHLMEQLRGDS